MKIRDQAPSPEPIGPKPPQPAPSSKKPEPDVPSEPDDELRDLTRPVTT